MANRGRPVEPVPEDLANEVIEWISNGKTLRDYCRQDGKPHFNTVYGWIEKDEDFAMRFAHARDTGHDVIAQECMEIIDTFPMMADGDGKSRIDAGHVAWMKNRVEMRLKLLAKWNPKKYGDKLDVEHKGSVGLNISINLGDE